jgi:hypothetical protein
MVGYCILSRSAFSEEKRISEDEERGARKCEFIEELIFLLHHIIVSLMYQAETVIEKFHSDVPTRDSFVEAGKGVCEIAKPRCYFNISVVAPAVAIEWQVLSWNYLKVSKSFFS